MRLSGAYASSRRRSEPSERKRTITCRRRRAGHDALAELVVHARCRRPRAAGRRRAGRFPAAGVVAPALDGCQPPPPPPPTRSSRTSAAVRSCSTRFSGISARNCDGGLEPRAPNSVRCGVDERQLAPRAGDRHVAEAALLLEVRLLDRARVREEVLLHPDHEDRVELEALRVVQRHQRDATRAVCRLASASASEISDTSCRKPASDGSSSRARTRARRRPAPAGSRGGPAPRSCRSASSVSITPVRVEQRSSSSPHRAARRRGSRSSSISAAERAHRARGGGRRGRRPRDRSSASQSVRPLKPAGGGEAIDARHRRCRAAAG